MGEITGAIVAITLVLLSVFVPVAFIPGISGQLFQQFAVAVSVSMVLSAINALTLTPGALRHPAEAAPRAEARAARLGLAADRRDPRRLRRRRHGDRPAGGPRRCCCSPSPSAASAGCSARVPTGFLPAEDQGAFFVEVRLPDGASVNRTEAAMARGRGDARRHRRRRPRR